MVTSSIFGAWWDVHVGLIVAIRPHIFRQLPFAFSKTSNSPKFSRINRGQSRPTGRKAAAEGLDKFIPPACPVWCSFQEMRDLIQFPPLGHSHRRSSIDGDGIWKLLSNAGNWIHRASLPRVGGVAPLRRMKLHWVKILGSVGRDGERIFDFR